MSGYGFPVGYGGAFSNSLHPYYGMVPEEPIAFGVPVIMAAGRTEDAAQRHAAVMPGSFFIDVGSAPPPPEPAPKAPAGPGLSPTALLVIGLAVAGAVYAAGTAEQEDRKNPQKIQTTNMLNPDKGNKIAGSVPWWAALAVGTGLIIFPEPATTATGTLIVLGTLGISALE